MAIHFQCPTCGKALAVRSEYAGKKGKCTCGAAVVVPAATPDPVPAGQLAAADDMIRFACDKCGRRIKVPPTRAGQKGKCPQCKSIITVPAADTSSKVEHVSETVKERREVPAKTIRVQCTMCSTVVEAKESAAGNLIECSKCGSFIEVPLPKGAAAAQAAKQAETAADSQSRQAKSITGRTVCPSCNKKLVDDAAVCVGCGIYVRSGRPILMTRGIDEGVLNDRARKVISPLSWLIPTGFCPVYSEVMGRSKPYAVWAITALTVLISGWFLTYEYSGSPKMRSMKNLMLWAGKGQPDPEHIQMLYEYTNYGDANAFKARKQALKGTVPEKELDYAAMKELSPQEQCFGKFRFTQLITHAFLHGGPIHLAGNMLFLLVFGSRVCSVIGNIWSPILYFILAIGAGFTHLVMSGMQPPMPMLGASGAVMGMAGVYLVLFPVQKIYMAAWWRWGLAVGFRLSFKVFAMRGFWVVLLYIFFDVVAVSLSAETGTAHWAHIGGFMWGIAAGIILLVSRAAHSGSDILSLIFGKYAWRLIGSPYGRG